MIRHVESGQSLTQPTLEWRMVIDNGWVELQCSKPDKGDWWYVIAIGPNGKLYREMSIPRELGLSLNDCGQILLTEVEP